MKLGIIGDVHGSTSWTKAAITRLATHGVKHLIQLGDFGIGLASRSFIPEVDAYLEHHGLEMTVVPGNHDDYHVVNEVAPGWLSEHIFLPYRGMTSSFDGKHVMYLGGAPSVDRTWRQRRMRNPHSQNIWWPEEALTAADEVYAIQAGTAEPVDFMFTHDAPYARAIDKQIAGNPLGFEYRDLEYAREGRDRMTRIVAAIRPKVLFHGHYHFKVRANLHWTDGSDGPWETGDIPKAAIAATTRLIGLSNEGTRYNIAVLDTDTTEIKYIDAVGARS